MENPADEAMEIDNEEILLLPDRNFKTVDRKFVHEIEYEKFASSSEDVFALCKISRIKVLAITKFQTLQHALHMLIHPAFYKNFYQLPFLFVVVLNIDQDGINFGEIDEYLQRLNDFYKEVIFQISSRNSSSLFFKEYCKGFKRLAINNIPNDIESGHLYSFEAICNMLHFNPDNLGRFESVIFKINLNTEKSLHLIDYAVKNKEMLTLRFLQLFRPDYFFDLEYVNEEGSRVLETAARYGNLMAFKILLDIQENEENLQSLLKPEDRRGLNQKVDGSNLLMLAASNQHFDVVSFLIDCGLDVNQVDRTSKTVSDFAWEAKKFEVVIKIIKADGPFPKIFNYQAHPGLQALKEERDKFHECLRSNNSDDPSLHSEFSKFLEENPSLKIIYNSENRCALLSAMQARQFEFYALLRSKGFRRGLDVDDSIFDSLSEWELKKLVDANKKFFKTDDYKHIMDLVSQSRVGFGSDNKHFKTIQRWYELLDENEMLQTIMKVISNVKVEIVFDFKKETVCNLDFKGDRTTFLGITYPYLDVIFIGAKQKPTEILATIAHEFTHYALQLVYKNGCMPFYPNDFTRSGSFGGILQSYFDRINNNRNWETIDPVIQIALSYTDRCLQICELIVRPPHLIALHLDNPTVLKGIREENSELFNFFEKVVIIDFKKEFPLMKAKQKVQELNRNILEVFTKFESSKVTCDNIDFSFDVGSEIRKIFIHSKVPGVCLSNLVQKLKRVLMEEVDASNIFVKLNQLADSKYTAKVHEAFHSINKPRLIVISEDPVDLQTVKEVFSHFKSKVVFIANLDRSSCRDIFPVQSERNYKWDDLTSDSKKHVLSQKISFQGQEIELSQIIETNDEILSQVLPIEEILMLHELKIEPLEKFFPSEIVGYIERTFRDSKRKLITQEGVLKLIEQGKSVLIANDAGVGKTMSSINFSRELKTRNRMFWVSYVDLKSYTASFFKDEEEPQRMEIDHSFMSEKLLKLTENREQKLFEHFYKSQRALFVFDGFDEISPNYKIFVLEIFKAVQSSGNRMLISTRVHLTEAIENQIRVEVIKLTPFTEENQIDLLVNLWMVKNPNRIVNDLKKMARSLLLTYADSLFGRSSRDDFLGIPLQVKMLAEIYEGLDQKKIEEIESDFNLFTLYKQFVEKKLTIWKLEKGPLFLDDSNKIEMNCQNIIQMHQRAALEYFFEENIVSGSKLPESFELIDNLNEVIARTGMLQMYDDLSVKFVHQTFAEYFVADFMFSSPNATIDIYEKVLQGEEFDQVRKFINDKIKVVDNKHFSQKMIIFLKSKYDDDFCGMLPKAQKEKFLQYLIKEKHLDLMQFIFLKLNLDKKSKLELMTKKYYDNDKLFDVMQFAISRNEPYFDRGYHRNCNSLEVFNTLWECVKSFCDIEEQKQLLGIDGENILVFAIRKFRHCRKEKIETILKIKFELLTRTELKEIFMPKDLDAFSFLDPNIYHFALSNSEIFETIWKFISQFDKEDQKEILMARNERNLLLLAILSKDCEVFELILDKFKKLLNTSEMQEVLNFMFDSGNFFHLAVSCGKFKIFCKVCDLVKGTFGDDKKHIEEILLAKDKNNETIFMKSSCSSLKQKIVRKLLEIAEEMISPQNIKVLLSAIDEGNENVLHKAANLRYFDYFRIFWNFMRKYLEDEELKAIVLAENNLGKNVIVATKYLSGLLNIAFTCLKQIFTLDELNRLLKDDPRKSIINLFLGDPNQVQRDELLKLLNERFEKGLVFHDIFEKCSIDVVSHLLKVLELKLSSEDLLELFSQRDSDGRNVLRRSSNNNDSKVREKLWDFLSNKLEPLGFKTHILTKTSEYNDILIRGVFFSFLDWHKNNFSKEELLQFYHSEFNSLFHCVAKYCDEESIQKFFDFSLKVFTREEIRDLLFDENLRNENTLWYSLENENISSFESFFKNAQNCLNLDEIEHLIIEPNINGDFAFNYEEDRRENEHVYKLREFIVELFGKQKLSNYFVN